MAAPDSTLFCFYIAPGMLVEARRAPTGAFEPAVVVGFPRDTLGAWELTGGQGDSAWAQSVSFDCIRPRRAFAAAAAAQPAGAAAVATAAAPAATAPAAHAAEVREMNVDCDTLELRLAALEAKQADAAAAADPLLNLADIAANVTHDDLRGDLEQHVATAVSAGVRYLVTPSMSADGPRGAKQTLQVARANPGRIFACAGVHPFWAAEEVGSEQRVDGADCTPAAVEALREVAAAPEVRCVGECGLDFCKPPSEAGGYPEPEAQIAWFEACVSIAVELEKPLYLHERDAFAQFVAVLKPLHTANMLPPCVVHAFTGTEAELEAYRGMDFYIGVSGFICRKKNPMCAWLPKLVPLSRLLVETDSPYMGFKGCRKTEASGEKDNYPNVPASLPMVLDAVAKCYGVTPAEIAEATTSNARRLFSI